jgi:hypothetical protein
VEAAIRADVGAAANPQVAFARDSTHLLIQLQADPFAELPDSAFTRLARQVAALALHEYQHAAVLDSVTVSAGETIAPNGAFRAFRVIRSHTFAITQPR